MMALIVRRRTVLAMQIVRIDWRVCKGNLIVVGVVKRLCQCVGAMELIAACKAAVHTEPQPVIMCVHARLEIRNSFRSADYGIENGSYRSPYDEMRSQVVNAI